MGAADVHDTTDLGLLYSLALEGLPIALLSQTLERLTQETNGTAAQWFAQQIANL